MKYVDFPFGPGADGTKLLRPRQGIDPRYAYRVLEQVRIPDGGYSRHFKHLSEAVIPVPPLEEQKRIAAILDAADNLRTKRRQALTKLDTLTQAIYHEMFGDPGENPSRYRAEQMIDLVDPSRPITYGILKPGNEVPSEFRTSGLWTWSTAQSMPLDFAARTRKSRSSTRGQSWRRVTWSCPSEGMSVDLRWSTRTLRERTSLKTPPGWP